LAILKYRLYDIDVVISRALVYGVLAATIGVVYVGVVAGFGALVGTRGEPNLVLSLVSTAADLRPAWAARNMSSAWQPA
jgi:hypothetical protein